MRYMVVVEEDPKSFGAYVPDLSGCVAVGESKQEVLQLIQEAIELHLEDIKDKGTSVLSHIPTASSLKFTPNPSFQPTAPSCAFVVG